MAWPEIIAAAGEARNRASAAISLWAHEAIERHALGVFGAKFRLAAARGARLGSDHAIHPVALDGAGADGVDADVPAADLDG